MALQFIYGEEKTMDNENTKVKFSDKHPVISLPLFTYGAYLLAQYVIGMIIMFPLHMGLGLDATTATTTGGVIGSLIVLLIWYKRWSPEYRFMPEKGDISGSFMLCSPFLVFWVILFGMYAVMVKGNPFGAPTLSDFTSALMAGISEEVIFREIAVSHMAKHWRSEKAIPIIALVSGVLFGMTHLTNVINGRAFQDVAEQSLLAVFWGLFMGAVYIRKGNVWVIAFVHALHDLLAFSGAHGLSAAGIDVFPTWAGVVVYVLEIGLGLVGVFLIRKSKRQEILELWDRKWSRG